MIDERTRALYRAPVIGELAAWLWARGWILCVLSLEQRLFWIQALRGKVKFEAEMRGTGDLMNACRVLMDAVRKADSGKGEK